VRFTQRPPEAHLWGAANILGGKTARQDHKNCPGRSLTAGEKRLGEQGENVAALEQPDHVVMRQ
jgi:hypothetical protein